MNRNMAAALAATQRGRSAVPVLLVALLVALAAAVALVWLPSPPAPLSPLPPLPEYAGPPARFAPELAPAAPLAQPDDAAAMALPGDDDAPWLHPPAEPAGETAQVAATAESRRIDSERTQRLQAIQEQLRDIAQSSEPDPQRLDSLLGELVAVEGSHIVGGVDMQVVRNNLQYAAEMQRLSSELESLAAAGNDPQNLVLMKEKVTRIQTLQQQLRTDVRVSQ